MGEMVHMVREQRPGKWIIGIGIRWREIRGKQQFEGEGSEGEGSEGGGSEGEGLAA